jgi:hypothetical protein
VAQVHISLSATGEAASSGISFSTPWAQQTRAGTASVTPGFKGQSQVHLIHAPKKTTYIITECIEINVTITSEYLLHCESLTK